MDKPICWAVKIANSKEEISGDLFLKAVNYYANIMMSTLSEIGVPSVDLVFAAVAASKITEMFRNDLDSEDKKLFEMLSTALSINPNIKMTDAVYEHDGEEVLDEE